MVDSPDPNAGKHAKLEVRVDDVVTGERLAKLEVRVDDHDEVIVGIRDHLKELSSAVQSWDRKWWVLIGVLAANSPLVGKLFGVG